MTKAAYDTIGRGYAETRRPDPRIAERIHAALAGCESVVNVGAGTGSYEPGDRAVTAVEPSAEMISQRSGELGKVVQASAEELPFEDDSFDAAMAVLTAHHWTNLEAGLNEMVRVARRRVVVLTFDPDWLLNLWITADYFPDILDLRRASAASSRDLTAFLPSVAVSAVLVPRDCSDHFLAALWGRPEMLFEEKIVKSMWVWQSIAEDSRLAGINRLATDLKSGRWDRAYGHLRKLTELDVGLRLIVSELGEREL